MSNESTSNLYQPFSSFNKMAGSPGHRVFSVVRALRELSRSVTGRGEVEEALRVVEQQRDALLVSKEELSAAQRDLQAVQVDIRRCYEEKTRMYQQGWEKRDLVAFERLLSEEVSLAKREKNVLHGIQQLDARERQAIDSLSDAIWMSHERELTRNERTKQLSKIASLLGALLGFAGSVLVHRGRLNKLQETVEGLRKDMSRHHTQEAAGAVMQHHLQQYTDVMSAVAEVKERVQCLETSLQKTSGAHVTGNGHVTSDDHVTVQDFDTDVPSSVSDSVWAIATACVGSVQFCVAALL